MADAVMLSASNLKDLHEAGLRFIVGSWVTKAPTALASHFRWHGDAFTDGQLSDTITPRIATAAARGVNDVNKLTEPVWDPGVHTRSWRAVWAYSRKRAVRDEHTLTLQDNRAKAVACADGCGSWLPARPGRRVVVFADPVHRFPDGALRQGQAEARSGPRPRRRGAPNTSDTDGPDCKCGGRVIVGGRCRIA